MRIAVWMISLAWGVGCHEADPSGTDPAPGPTEPTEPAEPPPSTYIYEEGDPPAPTATLPELSGALQVALDTAMTIQAQPVQRAYDAAMQGRTPACPYVYTTPDGSYWYDSCTANDGTEFDGYVFAYGADDVPYGGAVYDYWYAFGGATVEDPQGHQLELAGAAIWQRATFQSGGTQSYYYYTDVGGTFRWDGPEADGTWLRSDIDPDLLIETTSVPSANASSSTLSGGFGGFGDGWAVAFDDNTLGSTLLGLPCASEVSGTLGLRAPDGSWYDIRFDGSDGTDPDFEAAACDGCGQAFYRGEPMGEVCADFSVLIEAGVAPW